MIKRNLGTIAVILGFSLVIGLCLFSVIHTGMSEQSADNKFKKLSESVSVSTNSSENSEEKKLSESNASTTSETEPSQQPTHSVEELLAMNKECYAWISIKDTRISYPVMHTPNEPDKYLNRNFYGQYSSSGVPYMDGRCTDDSDNKIIYGHHMDFGSMFSDLCNYTSRMFRDTHQSVVLETHADRETYKVFAALRVKADNGINNLRPKNKKKKLYPPIKRPSTIAMVDDGDVHAIMIGAAGVGKTAYWLYPCIEYACATGMSFLSTDTKGDIVRNYGEIASKYYDYNVSVIDLRNPTRSNRCVFYCDEFGTLPKIESAEMMFSASRSRRLQIVPIIQSFAQLEKNYGKEGADVIVDNTQLTIFGGFAPNSTSAETLSKALGSRTVMSGSVSRSKDNPSQSVQMIERPLMTADELKNLPKGTFVVMKTAKHPMKVKLKLFFLWGIQFEKPYMVSEQGNRKVRYVSQSDLAGRVSEKYKKFPKKTEVEVKKTNSDAFDIQMEMQEVSIPVVKIPNERKVYRCQSVFAIDKKEPEYEPESEVELKVKGLSNPIDIKFEIARKNNAESQEKIKREKAEQMAREAKDQEVDHGQ